MANKKFNTVEQATIEWTEIIKTAGRPTLRAQEHVKTGRQTYKIPFNSIRLRDTFNFRIKPEGMSQEEWEVKLEIPEMMESMLAGIDTPEIIKGDFTPDGKLFIVSDGHRRFMATARALREGHKTYKNGMPIEEVEVLPNPQGYTDLDRFRQVFSTNRAMALNPIETGRGILRIKEEYRKTNNAEMSNDQVAEFIGGVSRQWVDNKIILTKLPDKIQLDVMSGTMKETAALLLHREETKQQKQAKTESKDGEQLFKKETPKTPAPPTPALPPKQSEGKNLNGLDEDKNNLEDEGEKIQKPLVKHDTTSVNQQEKGANKPTNPNFVDPHKKSDGNDALGKIDFKKEKTEAEMDIAEILKMIDKVEVRNNTLPDSMKQFKNDQNGLLNFISRKLQNVLVVIKKAPDER